MSFNKARERQQQAPDVVSDHGLLCRIPGCVRRWSVDISHGRVCSMHDEILSRESICRAPSSVRTSTPRPLPTLGQVVKPFCEVDDEEDF